MADKNAVVSDVKNFDMSTYDFGHSGCAWCHPGGGALEYDRDGYRYDGRSSLFQYDIGYNPNTNYIPPPDGTVMGDYYSFENGQLVSKVQAWRDSRGAEADCLMCHYSEQYANLERNYAPSDTKKLYLAASLGLVGAGTGTSGPLSISQKGSWDPVTQTGTNPVISNTTWSWVYKTISKDKILTSPKKENCSICHFPDKSMAPMADKNGDGAINCSDEPEKCGPAGKPLGFTAYQKMIKPGQTTDGDLSSSNTSTWIIAKGRVEGGKRGESLNDPNNPDTHMKAISDSGFKMTCVDCHYMLSGKFKALKDGDTNVIQPEIDVFKIDHQFAKGNNAPDGKNMDQLDNTVTCAGCHIKHDHPKMSLVNGDYILTGVSGTVKVPIPTHAGFPGMHIDKIDCRTCHIPVLNSPMKQITADFTAGPYRNSERTQTEEKPKGVGYKPLYMWRATEHDGTGLKIQPITTMAVPVWAEATEWDSDGTAKKTTPTFQRLAKAAAEEYRAGSGITDGAYNWKLNADQAGDTNLIINTTDEINSIVSILTNTLGVTDPVMHFYFNQFVVSHNVMPKAGKCIDKNGDGDTLDEGECNYILGSIGGGGCVMCHASSDPASPRYSNKSVGFFDKTHTLFKQPTEGGGLKQTERADGKKLVNVKFPAKKWDGSSFTINLSNVAAGANVINAVEQEEAIGYAEAYRDYLMSFMTTTEMSVPDRVMARISYKVVGRTVSVDATGSAYADTYTWDFGGTDKGSLISGGLNQETAAFAYNNDGIYTVKLTAQNISSGMSASKMLQVTVQKTNSAPTAAISGVVNVADDMTVTLTDNSSDGADQSVESLTVFINWGDGQTTKQDNGGGGHYSHSYTQPAIYNITYSVIDSGGLTDAIGITNMVVPKRNTISGMATWGTDASGLGGATITVKDLLGDIVTRTVTTNDGTYSVGNILPGGYLVSASKAGDTYVKGFGADIPVSLSNGLGATNIDFNEPYLVSGVITNGAGITVKLINGSVEVAARITDGDGKYAFTGVANGDYTVDPVESTTPGSVSVTVSNGNVSGIDFTNP